MVLSPFRLKVFFRTSSNLCANVQACIALSAIVGLSYTFSGGGGIVQELCCLGVLESLSS